MNTDVLCEIIVQTHYQQPCYFLHFLQNTRNIKALFNNIFEKKLITLSMF